MPTKRDSRAPCHQQKLTRHELAIRTLVLGDPGIHRNGFAEAVRALWDELDAASEYGLDPLDKIAFRPDAYKVDRETETLILYEVEDSHPIPAEKLRQLAWFWFCWDAEAEHEWLPELHTVDRYGRMTGQIDLCSLYYTAILAEHRRTPALAEIERVKGGER